MKAVDKIIRESMLGLLRPVVRFALKHSIKFQDFQECAKAAYVRAAEEELAELGEQLTASKLSALTGMQRREVKRLSEEQPRISRGLDLITRVVGLWQTSEQFRTQSGKAKTLTFHAREGEFVELVASVSKDLNPYTVLFELERAGIAKNSEDGVTLIKDAYQPSGDVKMALRLLAEDSYDLHESVEQNIFSSQERPNLHIKTEFDNIPPSHATAIRRWFLRQGAAFHQEARKYLSGLDRDSNSKAADAEGSGRLRAVIGTFSLTEELKDDDGQDPTK